MPAAARAGDLTSHGQPLSGTGTVNVHIGGKPAWRALTDFHTCPLSDPTPAGPKPHVGGVSKGSASVLINKVPAARKGDAITEAGPPNSIASGCTTVSIGG